MGLSAPRRPFEPREAGRTGARRGAIQSRRHPRSISLGVGLAQAGCHRRQQLLGEGGNLVEHRRELCSWRT